MHANDLPLVAQAVSPANRIFSQLLTVGALIGAPCSPPGDRMGTVTRFLLFLLAAGCVSAQPQSNGLYAIFNTSMGKITARLYEKDTPVSVENFVALAQGTKETRDPKTRSE